VSNSSGLGVLKRSIGDRHWVSAKVQIDFGNYADVSISDGEHKHLTILRVDTLHSVYALSPPYNRPQPTQYHNIEDDLPGINGETGDALDFDIATKVSTILSAPALSKDQSCAQ